MDEPEPPVDVPKYLKEGLANQSPGILRALVRWAELAAYHEEQPPEANEDVETITRIQPGHVSGYSRIEKYQRWGDETYKCISGTQGDMHGSYLWHVYTRGDGTRK